MEKKHERRVMRLAGYDYGRAGAYFVTICTHEHRCLFGRIVDGTMVLNDAGRVVEKVWDDLPRHYARMETDAFVIMPNHVHGIIVLAPDESSSAAGAEGAMNRAPTLGNVVRGFKGRVTIGINRMSNISVVRVWQRNYYEHVVRNEKDLDRIREYIMGNPGRWVEDHDNPANADRVLRNVGTTRHWSGSS
ncbi:MAG: transposase [Deltaproteobacteria bacterium]|nr:transposase [Deltaproteobacteria bacterium]